MSVLDRMRSGTDSTAMQIILGLVVVSFVWYGGKNRGDDGGAAAVVDGEIIPDLQFGRRYGQIERQREDRLDRGLTDAEQAQLRDDVLAAMIQEKVLEHEAERLGLEISDQEKAMAIAADPYFQENGKFSLEKFKEVLKRMHQTEAEHEIMVRDDLERQRIAKLVGYMASVSDAEARQLFVDSRTKIELTYVRIPPVRFGDDVDVGQAAIDAFVAENKPAIEAAYKADFERLYKIPDKVSIDLISLSKRDDGVSIDELATRLEKIKAEIEAGGDFAAAAARWSEHETAGDGGAQGEVAVRDLPQAVQSALSPIEPGKLTAIVKDDAQVRLYRLVSRTPGREVPLEEATPDIAKRLLRDRDAPKLAAAYAEQVLAAWKASGTAPVDVLAEKGFDPRSTGPVSGDDLTGPAAPPKTFVAAAQTASPGAALPEVYEEGGVYWVGSLDARTTADPAAFDAEKEDVRRQVALAKRALVTAAWRKAAVASATVRK